MVEDGCVREMSLYRFDRISCRSRSVSGRAECVCVSVFGALIDAVEPEAMAELFLPLCRALAWARVRAMLVDEQNRDSNES